MAAAGDRSGAAHVSRWVPGDGAAATPPLVLLHGTDGDEEQLLPLGAELAPGSARLGIRGAVETDAGFAFFRRFADRRVDEVDVARRARVLGEFVESSCVEHGLAGPPLAVGFSNGAIMAAALLMTRPGLLAGAILFRPLSPFTGEVGQRLERTPVLVVDGVRDARRSLGDGRRLAERLTRAGAALTHHVLPAGHALTSRDVEVARAWLAAFPGGASG